VLRSGANSTCVASYTIKLGLDAVAFMFEQSLIVSQPRSSLIDDMRELARERQWRELVGMISVLAIFWGAIGGGAVFLGRQVFKSPPPVLVRDRLPDLSSQIQEMEQVQLSLKRLAAFIESQKERIRKEQDALSALSKERSDLEPIMKAQRQAIDELFTLQEQRATRNKWKDISIGIVLGVLSSLIATVFFELMRRWAKLHRTTGQARGNI
jgi:hypothetical protein